jgi:hypothetical protein
VLHIVDETYANVALVEVASGRVAAQVSLAEMAVSADRDATGMGAIYVTADGSVKWFGDGTIGTIAEGGYLAARC